MSKPFDSFLENISVYLMQAEDAKSNEACMTAIDRLYDAETYTKRYFANQRWLILNQIQIPLKKGPDVFIQNIVASWMQIWQRKMSRCTGNFNSILSL